ncbi:MAG: cytochrome P450 [Acidimicrobiia bacterium]|nr:cytochrome P450 [Acidimicrobiia bacterium]
METTELDFFRDGSLLKDPYPFFDALRDECPVRKEPYQGVFLVTGYEEALQVYHDTATFSSANSVTGPFPGFATPLEGDDVTEQIEEQRDALPFSDQLPTFDPPKHTAHRGLLMRLITPKRLKENEDFIWALADRQIDEVLEQGTGKVELISEFANPFAMLVIADLLGVPEADHEIFRRQLATPQGGLGSTKDETLAHKPLEWLYGRFSAYIEERRHEPRDDVLTKMAQATYPDGSTPDIADVTGIAANLFAAGQETTVRLIGASLQRLGDDAKLQQELREDGEKVANFVEEMLRFESPVKGDFRVARVATNVGGVDIPAGTTVMVLNAAANRDPRKFECPAEFRPDRDNARENLAFGHGIHFCPGAPLARTEGRVSVQRLLDRLDDIRISDEEHGPPGAREFRYLPTFILRGVSRLHLTFTPAG